MRAITTRIYKNVSLSRLITETKQKDNTVELTALTQDNLISIVKVGEHISSCNYIVVRIGIDTQVRDEYTDIASRL